MTRTEQDDTGTDRRLVLLVGLVVVSAAIAAVISIRDISAHGIPTFDDLATAAKLTFLVVVGATVSVRIRIRSTPHGISWTEVAVLAGLAFAPIPWVILCTGLGVGIARAIVRLAPLKLAFGVAKDMLLATAAGLVFLAMDWSWSDERPLSERIVPLIAAYLVVVVLDEALTLPVISLASRVSLSKLFSRHWDLRLASGIARLLVVGSIVLILQADKSLLLIIPPLVLSLHLAYSSRLRSRAERDAWQQLARATDALNDVDLNQVLRTAVHSAADLFNADQVEVTRHDGGRTIRGDSTTITFDGPTGEPPPSTGTTITTPLQGHDGVEIGLLHLWFPGPIQLSERERYTLRTFASALCTAIRNASAYAELTRVADEHAHAASHDVLTGLANRRHLLERGTEQLDRRHADGLAAVLLIDLNHFKEVNDTLGHPSGDRVLIVVADRLRAVAGPDDLVARLGGDEFAILISGLPAPAVATHRAERLLAALHEPIELDGMRISVEASGGIAVAPGTGGMPELLRRADVAMYQAKRAGLRLTSYAANRDTADVGRLTLSGDLSRAVAEREFTVDFQPIVDLCTGAVVAAEALARWQHPTHGTIDPLRFLDAVERSGLLPAFTGAVLDQSIVAADEWQAAGFDLTVAVNVSPRSLLDASFPEVVLDRLESHGLPPERLVLELTENLTLSQLEVVDRVLGQLRDAGVRLALDDFGTGYSSLSVLSRIPVHELKIDRTFVMAMETSAEAVAVIRSTVDLGRSLDLLVIAEGVESEPQRRALWELGCTAGQGHLFARPMTATRMLAALRRGADGRSGALAQPLHDEGSVIRLSPGRRTGLRQTDRLPHLPA
ncbi:diguanylate cyclase/phosphodiesterase [Micromonospora pisi]|uniref:Diguanylate cyclase/phosphodiesterase n=1 Tax=Micromonospora pisi TaxID=589240 RepID=A0A495JKZ1_9ACTN|nr:bifunctional diguanylate cyclase/phosphodiesterase [Micromonospora pisi]RKR89315.1 diguanylate cyclase/phosphodiesterase [Micromonospora pisi]